MRVLCEVYILNWPLFSRILFYRPHHHLSTQLKGGQPFSSPGILVRAQEWLP